MEATRYLAAVAAALWLGTATIASAASYSASQSGPWSSASTWGGAGVPGSADNVTINRQNTTVTGDVANIGEILILEANTIVEVATNLNMSAGLRIGGGGYASGPGLVRTHGYDITTTYISFGDWGYGLMEVDPGTTITAAYITDQNQGSRMTVTHLAGRNGLTFVIPDPNIQSNFRLRLNFDPLSKATNWAFRWQGSRKTSIDTWLSNGRMTNANVQAVRVVEEGDGYTYVYAVPYVIWSSPCASNITDSSANARANLSIGGYTNSSVTVYWGTTDGGTTNTAWAGTNVLGMVPTGPVSGTMTGLTSNTRYYFRLYTTNTEASVQGWSAAGSFTSPWYPGVDNSTGATVSVGSAVLRGNLTTGNVADVYIYWGRTDGGTSTAYENVIKLPDTTQGVFQTTVNVGYGFSNYYYVCFASNSMGMDWAAASTNFSMPEPPTASPPTSGRVLWLDASQLGLSDGAGVTSFTDMSGLGNHAGNAVGGGGTFKTSAIGGKPVVRFINSQYLYTSTSFVRPWTMLHVTKMNGGSDQRLVGGVEGNRLFGYWGGGRQQFHPDGTYRLVGGNPPAGTDPHVYAFTIGSSSAMWEDGVYISGTTAQVSDIGRLELNGYTSGNELSNGDIAELMIYNRVLSSNELQQAGSYLAWKYGLTTAYPAASAPMNITNSPVSNLTTNSATLNGYLGGSGWSFDVFVCWGTNDGQTVAANWQSNAFVGTFHSYAGAISYAVTNLAQTSRCYYAFFATNSATNVWAQQSGQFETLGPLTVSNMPASAITQTNVTLSADMSKGGYGELRIYWGLADGNTTPSSWQNTNSFGGVLQGTYSTTITVRAGAPYYYRVYATNLVSEDWADTTAQFSTPVPAVKLTALPASPVGETGAQAIVTATLSAPSVSNVTVNYTFSGGATKDTDYSSSADSVTINAGTLSSNIVLTATDDAGQEEDESIVVSILSVSCATNGAPAAVTNTITSDDPQISNSTGASAITASNATLNGVLTMGDSATVRVFWGDNDAGTVFADWDATNALGVKNEDTAFTSPIAGLVANKTYYYRCYATNASLLAEDWADSTATFVTIAPSVSINDVTVTEGDTGEVNAIFSVRISTPSFIDVSVACTASNGTATTAGLDYVATNAVVTIPAGQTNATFTVRVLADTLYEAPDEVFYVNLTAPSGCSLGDPQGVCTVDDDDLPVYLADWRYRMKITFSGYNKPETLTNFPALVVMKEDASGFLYSKVASPVGGDLRFANSNELVLLNHEIERWEVGSNSYIWVQVPELVDSNTYIWAYWGNAAETNAPAYTTNGATWSAGFHQVYHMTRSNAQDSTAYKLNGSVTNAAVVPADGIIGKALSFNEAGAVTLPYYDRNTAPYTLSAWINTADLHGAILGWIFYEPQDHLLIQTLNGKLRFFLNAWTGNNEMLSPQNVNDSQWHHCVAVRAANTTGRLYVDGVQVASHGGIGTTRGGGSSFIGRTKAETWNLGVTNDYYYSGLIDEVRACDADRSTNWIWACYSNQVPGSTFYTCGQVLGGPSITVVYGATNITYDSAWVTAQLLSTGGSATATWLYWGTTNGGEAQSGWGNTQYMGDVTSVPVDYSVQLTSLARGTRYYYAYMATNGEGTNWAAASFYTIGSPILNNTNGAIPAVGYATLRGHLEYDGGSPATVHTYWGDNDGDTNKLDWDYVITNGVTTAGGFLTNTPSTLVYGRPYYYRTYATNTDGESWAPGTTNFFTLNPISGRRLKVSFTNYTGGPLTNFPALVKLSTNITDFTYSTFLTTNGYDLRFLDAANTTNLNYEIEQWNTNGESLVWVQIPAFTNNCYIWADWGSSSATNQPAYTTNGATWSEGYVGVWHLADSVTDEQTTGSYRDSSGNNNPGSQYYAGMTNGMVGRCGYFDGNDYIRIANESNFDFQDKITASVWFKSQPSGWVTDWSMMVTKGVDNFWTLRRYSNTEQILWHLNNDNHAGPALSPSASDGNWHYFAGAYQKSPVLDARSYYDGNLYYVDPTPPATLTGNNDPVQISGRSDGYYFRGLIDEVRISHAYRSADWLSAEYRTIASNGTFTTYETGVGGGSGALANLAATNLTTTSATFQGLLNATGAVYSVSLYWGGTDSTTNTGEWVHTNAIGTFTNVTTNLTYDTGGVLTPGTAYFYAFRAWNDSTDLLAQPSAAFYSLGQPVVNNGNGAVVTSGYATVWGNLVSDGGSPVIVRTYWGDNDGDTNKLDWDFVITNSISGTGPFSAVASNTLYGQWYYYRTYASNGTGESWAPATTNFLTLRPTGTLLPVTDGLKVWLRADVGVQTNGSSVTNWLDQTTNCLNASQGNASYQPLFYANTLNGLPVLRFDGANDYLNLGNLGSHFPSAATLLIVGTIRGSDTYYNLLTTQGNDGDPYWAYGSTAYLNAWRTDRPAYASSMASSGSHLWTLQSSSSRYQLWTNGATVTGTQPSPSYSAGNNYILGCTTTLDANHALNGDMAEVIIYNRALSSNEMDLVGGYLETKYGLATAYPGYIQPQLLSITNRPATEVTAYTAKLNATLACTGAVFDVTVFWNTTNGGTNSADWTNSAPVGVWSNAVSTNLGYAVTGLDPNTTYYFAFRATNVQETMWATNVLSLLTGGQPAVNNSTGATVSVGQAILRGNLTQGNSADIYVYWGRTDGGTSAAYENVVKLPGTVQGAFSTTVAAGYGFSNYYYVCFASNEVGMAWAAASTNFVMPQPMVTPPTSGLVCWYDAGFGVTNDGSGVLTWTDKSGQGHNGTRAANTITLVANQLNGQPVLQCRSGYFNVAGSMFVKEQYVVGRGATATWNNYGAFLARTDTRNGSYLFENGNRGFHSNQYPTNVVRNGNNVSPIDGTCLNPIDQWMVLKVTVNANDTGQRSYYISRSDHSMANLDVAEILGYSTTLSSADQNKVGAYLAGKYAITTTYPPAIGVASLTNAPVSNLTTNSATLNGYLGGAGWSFDVSVYWGRTNGITTNANWETNVFLGTFHSYTGALSLTVSNLAETSQYYYAFFMTNTVTNIWAQQSAAFQTLGLVIASNGAVTGITQTNATLGAKLDNGGFGELRIYWGLTDGDTNAGAWQNTNSFGGVLMGTYTTTVTVRAGGPYYYRAYATNALSEDWADATAKFATPVPSVSLTPAPASPIAENGGQSIVSVRLSAPSVSNVTVNFSFGGAAVKGFGNDYTSSADSVVIPFGSVSNSITLTSLEDTLQEEDEAMTVGIASLSNGTNGSPTSVSPLITSDDPQVTNGGGVTLVTSNSATLNGVLTMGDSATIKVFWGDNDGATTYANWDATNSLGSKTEDAAFNSPITGLLANKTYYYRCYATNASLLAEDWADSTVSFLTGNPSVTINDVAVTEGDGGTVNATFTLTVSTLSYVDVSVTCTASNGTATAAGSDYLTTNAVVTILAGQSNATFTVKVAGDTAFEFPDDVFYVNLTAPSSCTIGDPQGVGTILDDDAAGYLANWRTWMPITFPGYAGTNTLTNWPALVRFTNSIPGFDYATFASGTGGDLRFATADRKRLLNFEIERWNTNGESTVWVQVPTLQTATGTTIYAYWNNPNETTLPVYTTNGATWSEAYNGVWRLAETNITDEATGGIHYDSTANRNNGSQYYNSPTNGMVDGAQYFDGTDYINCGDKSAFNNVSRGTTVSLWFYSTSANNYPHMFTRNGDNFQVRLEGSSRIPYFRVGGATLSAVDAVSLNQWYHVAATFDDGSNTARVYLNGVQKVENTGVSGSVTTSGDVYIGKRSDGYQWFGRIDQVEYASQARSADWVKASYSNQVQGASFNAFGPIMGLPLISVVYGATNITQNSADVTARLTSTGGAVTATTLYWGTTNGGQATANWAYTQYMGTATSSPTNYSFQVPSLTDGTRYYYAYMATNFYGTNWAAATFFTLGRPIVNNGSGASPGIGYATLNGSLDFDGGVPATVYTYWGDNDGDTNKLDWDYVITNGVTPSGLFSSNTPPTLIYGKMYYYRTYATNSYGGAWATSTTNFASANPLALPVACSGGTITNYTLNGTNYTAHIFTNSGVLTVTAGGPVEVLVVGGGGQGGWTIGAGGGAGGLLYTNGYVLGVGTNAVVVGGGGAGGASWLRGVSGTNSSFGTNLVAYGGGGGGGWADADAAQRAGLPGGSGGGGARNYAGGARTNGQGNVGGTSLDSTASSGGGGAGSAGTNGLGTACGAGGAGLAYNLEGFTKWYAGGGGGGAGNGATVRGLGGIGGGGEGGRNSGDGTGTNGVPGTGGGGGGGGYNGTGYTGGRGGSGIVVVRYTSGGGTAGSAIVNLAASNVTQTTATMVATMNATGAVYNVSLYWGPSNGSNNAAAWTNVVWIGAFTNVPTTNLTFDVVGGLTPGTAYYYAFRGSNEVTNVWSQPSTVFYTMGPPVVDNGTGAASGVGTATLRGTLLSTGGAPVTVYTYWGDNDGGTSKLDWDMVYTNGSTAAGSFSNVVSNLLYGLRYYYRTFATNINGEAWAANTTNFLTLKPSAVVATTAALRYLFDTGAAVNSGTQNVTTTTSGSPTFSATGGPRPGMGYVSFNGTGQYIDILPVSGGLPNLSGNSPNTYTLAMWIKTTTQGGAYFFKGNPTWQSADQTFFLTSLTGNSGSGTWTGTHIGGVQHGGGFIGGSANVADGNWNFITIVRSNGTAYFYANGVADGTATSMGNAENATQEMRIGVGGIGQADGQVNFNGLISGVHVYTTALSASEVQALASYSGASALSISNSATTFVTNNTATVAGILNATNSVFDVYLHYGPSDAGTGTWASTVFAGSYTNVETANITKSITGLFSDSNYYWAFRASNAATNMWAQPSLQFHTTMGPCGTVYSFQ